MPLQINIKHFGKHLTGFQSSKQGSGSSQGEAEAERSLQTVQKVHQASWEENWEITIQVFQVINEKSRNLFEAITPDQSKIIK